MRADTMRAALVLALSTIYAAAVHPKGAAFSARGGVRATSASCPAPPGGTAARGYTKKTKSLKLLFYL